MAGDELAEIAARARTCTLCRLHESRTQAVPGEGAPDARILLVGEGPGKHEDETGRPFVGAAGRVLDEALARAGLSRPEVFITNVVKCRPPENRKPKADEAAACAPYLEGQIRALRPAAIVALGDTAVRALLGYDLPTARRGRHRYEGAEVVATYHPAAALYNRRLVSTIAKDLQRALRASRPGGPRTRSGRPRPAKAVRPARSSGCAVFNAEGRILLLRRADEGMWCLPKGTIEPGESPEAAAVREVKEESGLQVRIVQPLIEVRYSFYAPSEDVNVDKSVAYFLAERTGGRLALEPGFEDARWCSLPEAVRLLHYENDRNVVRAAFHALGQASGGTRGPARGASS